MDAPRGTYVHWILWNIDPETKEIKENSIPEGAVQGGMILRKITMEGLARLQEPTDTFLRSMPSMFVLI